MPVRNRETREWVREGKLVVLGIAQEHHRDRSRLFAQWQKLDWPIVHDPINVMQTRGVPIEVAIDENGIVRSVKPNMKTFEAEFLDKTFEPVGVDASAKAVKAARPDLGELRRRAEKSGSSAAWRGLGDALVLWGGAEGIDKAIGAYEKAIEIEPGDGDAFFRLGVCYRFRYESEGRKEGDFQRAVDYWGKARAVEPNQYIWRRRIEQYGPRLAKPYPFYDWVETAMREVRARGEQPVSPGVLLSGSEIASPARRFEGEGGRFKSPDAEGRILRDVQGLVEAEVTVVPSVVKAGGAARVYVTLGPNAKHKAHWNNEAGPLKLWVDVPGGWKVQPQLVISPQGEQPETSEARELEFEVYVPAGAQGVSELKAYALYYVCEGVDGVCYFLRQDIGVAITVN